MRYRFLCWCWCVFGVRWWRVCGRVSGRYHQLAQGYFWYSEFLGTELAGPAPVLPWWLGFAFIFLRVVGWPVSRVGQACFGYWRWCYPYRSHWWWAVLSFLYFPFLLVSVCAVIGWLAH